MIQARLIPFWIIADGTRKIKSAKTLPKNVQERLAVRPLASSSTEYLNANALPFLLMIPATLVSTLVLVRNVKTQFPERAVELHAVKPLSSQEQNSSNVNAWIVL